MLKCSSFRGSAPVSSCELLNTWVTNVTSNGGTYDTHDLTTLEGLCTDIEASTYKDKLIYFMPFMGTNFNAALVPFVDKWSRGNATSNGLGPTNYVRNQGMINDNEPAKNLQVNLQFGVDQVYGLGAYQIENLSVDANGSRMMGYQNENVGVSQGEHVFEIYAHTGPNYGFTCGFPTSAGILVFDSIPDTSYFGLYVGSTDKRFFRGGVKTATETDTTVSAIGNMGNMRIMGNSRNVDGNHSWYGRMGAAWLTDNTITDQEAADIHTLVETHLVTARALLPS